MEKQETILVYLYFTLFPQEMCVGKSNLHMHLEDVWCIELTTLIIVVEFNKFIF